MKKELRAYSLAIQGLEDKQYLYDFEGDKTFFAAFDQDFIEEGHFKAEVVLDKSSTMLRLKFLVTGEVQLVCDRSLELYWEPFEVREEYIFKFGDRSDILADSIELIPFGTPEIDISQHLLDFIILALPMKRIHPDVRTEEDEADDDVTAIWVYSDGVHEPEEELTKEEEEEKEMDPRWAALQNWKSKN
ncbi:MAG: YceD family protein [Spirosomataceae bacterium]